MPPLSSSHSTEIQHAAHLLEAGKLVAIPTETVYGLAANALSSSAVAEIFRVKNRPTFDPLIIHLAETQDLEKYVQQVPLLAYSLAQAFWPGPLTLVLPRRSLVPDLVTAGLPTVGVRVPRHPLTRALLQSLDFPLAAPSANPFGYVSPTTADHVRQQLGAKIDFILDGGPCEVGLESTIIAFEEERPRVLRLGGIALEALQEVVGSVEVQSHSSSQPQAPGMLSSHYAPGPPVVLMESRDEIALYSEKIPPSQIGFIGFWASTPLLPALHQHILSPSGHLSEAAARLFAALRALDQPDIRLILAEVFPEEGLGRAINDRLRRAAAKRT
ncbi:MAG: L-threonylcarbamoyladenylate synthase [Microscillaceae bacterium]